MMADVCPPAGPPPTTGREALARRAVKEDSLGDRVEVRQADATRLDDEDRCDLVTMNIALHDTGGPAEYREVLARARRALSPDGTLLVSELPYPDSPTAYCEAPRGGAAYLASAPAPVSSAAITAAVSATVANSARSVARWTRCTVSAGIVPPSSSGRSKQAHASPTTTAR